MSYITLQIYIALYSDVLLVIRQIACSNGQLGFGRRRRDLISQADPNKIFEVTMMTFLKVDETVDESGSKIEKLEIDMVEEVVKRGGGAVEHTRTEVEGSYQANKPSLVPNDDPSFHASQGNEPVFIYYNTGSSHTQNMVIVLAAVFMVLFCH